MKLYAIFIPRLDDLIPIRIMAKNDQDAEWIRKTYYPFYNMTKIADSMTIDYSGKLPQQILN